MGVWSAKGISYARIAERQNWSNGTVGKWRQRFIEDGVQGFYNGHGPGRPRSVSDERVAVLLRRTLNSQPPGGIGWSVRRAAEANRLSKATAHRVFRTFDRFYIEKVRDTAGLYLLAADA